MSIIRLTELCTPSISSRLRPAPRFYLREYFDGICSLSTAGKAEEEATPATTIITPRPSPGDCLYAKEASGFLIRKHRIDATARG